MRFSPSRARDFACRRKHGNGKFTHASAHFPLPPKSQNRKMGNEFIGFREICGRPDGTQKCQKTHFLGCKSVSFCILVSALGGQKCEMTHFLPLKNVSFCTFACPRGDWDSHQPLCFAVSNCNSVISGKLKVRARVRGLSVSVFAPACETAHTRAQK